MGGTGVMVAVLMAVELHLPACRSLKDKRGVLSSMQARLRRDLGVSVAEVYYQDLWQRSLLEVAIAASSEIGGRKVAQNVERLVARDPRVEMVGVDLSVAEVER